ncbi:MAG: hypothetical protein AAF616_03215 [Bacteroidota bacterium]
MFENLNPLDKSTATLEILIMLIVAFIIGFIIAWILRRPRKSVITAEPAQNTKNDSLERDLRLLRDENSTLKRELEECKAQENSSAIEEETKHEGDIASQDKENAEKLGFKPASASQKDDLTKIKGIGPFIEKKLNSLGIYTFEQIESFTPDTVEKVTDAIQFFPGRIDRDDWVGQAKRLK